MRKSASSTGLLAVVQHRAWLSSSRTTLSTSSSTVGAELAPSSTPMLALCRLVREMKLPRGDRRTFRAGGMEGGEGRRFSFGGEGTKVVDCLGLGGGREGDPGSCSGCNSSAARLSTTASIPTVSLAAEECAAHTLLVAPKTDSCSSQRVVRLSRPAQRITWTPFRSPRCSLERTCAANLQTSAGSYVRICPNLLPRRPSSPDCARHKRPRARAPAPRHGA